jgi:AcrR family transcriptional regulator
MPYPSQITRKTIIQTARQMIETDGVDHLSLSQVAAELGVKTPSLYRYIKNKNGLLQAVNESTSEALYAALYPSLEENMSPIDKLKSVAHVYRKFAKAHPRTYGLLFTNTIAELRPDPEANERGALPIQAVVADITGEEVSLAALRGLLALVHGFVMLEIAEQFQRGGDLDQAFNQAVEAYLQGWLL